MEKTMNEWPAASGRVIPTESDKQTNRPCGPGVAHAQCGMIRHCIRQGILKYNLQLNTIEYNLMLELLQYSIAHHYDVSSAVSLIITTIDKQFPSNPLNKSAQRKCITVMGSIDDIKFKVVEC